jgi:hypothetical protein
LFSPGVTWPFSTLSCNSSSHIIIQVSRQPPLEQLPLREPPVHAQPYEDGARRCDSGPPTPHTKHALALTYNSLLAFQLRVTRNVCECAEADKGCAACAMSATTATVAGNKDRNIPTTRQGVQSSNCALSCFSASLKVGGGGGAISFAMAAVKFVWEVTRLKSGSRLHHCLRLTPAV